MEFKLKKVLQVWSYMWLCNNCLSKKPVIENKMCDNHTTKLDMTCVVASICACNHMPFIVRPVVSRNQIPRNESITIETSYLYCQRNGSLLCFDEWV